MMLNNLNPADYQSRLHNSIVRYDGIPCALTVHPNDIFNLQPIHPRSEFKPREIKSTDRYLDISSPKLGWFDYNDGINVALYAERSPVRRWRQGLCSTNTNMWRLSGGILRGQSARDCMYCSGFERMLMNKYPPLDDVLKSLENQNVDSIAVTRNIAISKKKDIYTVWFKKDEVGWMKPGTKLVKVAKEENAYLISRFLREVKWEIE